MEEAYILQSKTCVGTRHVVKCTAAKSEKCYEIIEACLRQIKNLEIKTKEEAIMFVQVMVGREAHTQP